MPSLEEIQAKFGAEIDETSFRDNRRLIVPSAKVFSLLAWLKDQGFNMLVDVTAAAVADLGVAPGSEVWVSAKATEISAYPAPGLPRG